MAKRKFRKASDKELDKAAEVTPEDIERAKAFARRNAPKGMKNLLDAEPVEDEQDLEDDVPLE